MSFKAITHYPNAGETKKLLIDLAQFRSNMVAQHLRLMELSDSAHQILSQDIKMNSNYRNMTNKPVNQSERNTIYS